MTATFDTTRLAARLATLRAVLQPAAEAYLPDSVVTALEDSGYAEPNEDEQNPLQAAELVTDVRTEGGVTSVDVVQLYDWILDPDANHCSGPGSCPELAAGGPWRSDELDVRPGEGTLCGANCHCTFEPRELAQSELEAALADAGQRVQRELAEAWGA